MSIEQEAVKAYYKRKIVWNNALVFYMNLSMILTQLSLIVGILWMIINWWNS